MKTIIFSVLGAIVLTALGYGMYLLAVSDNPAVAAAAITAASAIIVSTATISVGRYLEKQQELDALHREKKIPIYGKFLDGLFGVFYARKGKKMDIVKFLQEWQQKIVLWGGPAVVNAYIEWMVELRSHEPNVKTIDSTEALILAIRKELGHNDKKLMSGIFPRFILREAELYLELSKKNPELTLSYLEQYEKGMEIGSGDSK